MTTRNAQASQGGERLMIDRNTVQRLDRAAQKFFRDDWGITDTLTKREARYLADQARVTTGVVWAWFYAECDAEQHKDT
jgi:hypothetical protein